MKTAQRLITAAVWAAVHVAGASSVLWDIVAADNPASTPASAADFKAAGVKEDLDGAVVSHVNGELSGKMVSKEGVTLSYGDGEAAKSVFANESAMSGAGSAVLRDYLVIRHQRGVAGPIHFRISGLRSKLNPYTEYSFYLWGIGDEADQNAAFSFAGETVTVSGEDPCTNDGSQYMAKFSFTTGDVVSDTLDFIWTRDGSNERAGFNAFAIVEVERTAPRGLLLSSR